VLATVRTKRLLSDSFIENHSVLRLPVAAAKIQWKCRRAFFLASLFQFGQSPPIKQISQGQARF
jgi:hypothetical protein